MNQNIQISGLCPIYPSEDPDKVQSAMTNILPDCKIIINKNSIKATSKNIDSLMKIRETISSKKSFNVYRRQLLKNLTDDSTWFYLNKQAAFVDVIALCEEADESPLGPIKIIIKSRDIENVINWILSSTSTN